MDDQILFSEKQKFRQWWLWVILLIANSVVIYDVYKQVIKLSSGSEEKGLTEHIISAGLTILFTIMFIFSNLRTEIKHDGVYVKFFPFHLSFKHYGWDKISKSYVRTYSPIGEYGGWGFRLGLFGKGRAFNVSGYEGLQLEFDNRKKLLIGTNKGEQLREALIRLGKWKQ